VSEPPRLNARFEIGALIRRAEVAGGFAAVLHRGDDQAGTLLLLTTQKGANPGLWERMPALDGTRKWVPLTIQGIENTSEFDQYVGRRHAQDPDLWVIELDVADPERFIAESGTVV
jgi:hypothetical protein